MIIGDALPNIPWEEREKGCNDVIWRYSKNPVIKANHIPTARGIFNSAVVPFNGAYAGVFRCDTREIHMDVNAGVSKDGINWEIEHTPIKFISKTDEPIQSEYKYDPRVLKLEDRYYITWCNGYHGPTIGLGYTFDFKSFYQLENVFLPFNRNGVLFPKKINGKYAILSRPSDNGHTPFGDIYYTESPDLCYWGKHRFVMQTKGGWQSTKIGPGPVPIETKEGWLLIYHGVITNCNGFVYSMGAALLDIDKPWQVMYRTRPYLLTPEAPYECVGFVPNVAFPCAALCDAPTGRIAIYYGAADTVTCLAFTKVDELVDFIKKNSF